MNYQLNIRQSNHEEPPPSYETVVRNLSENLRMVFLELYL
jgi:hypothetical protein